MPTICEDEPGIVLRNDDRMKCPYCEHPLRDTARKYVDNSIAKHVFTDHCQYCEGDFECVRVSDEDIVVRPES